jgi:signal transduction histidine kinase
MEVSEAVHAAIADLEIKILEKNGQLQVGELPVVKGNKAYLTHLFMNLLSNALKFCEGTPVINIYGSREGSKAIIYIKDNGIGMSKSDLNKIFIAFHRLHSKARFEGSGIGLAISKRIVDLHRGNITVESEVGQGTTFKIELEAAEIQNQQKLDQPQLDEQELFNCQTMDGTVIFAGAITMPINEVNLVRIVWTVMAQRLLVSSSRFY